MTPYTTKTMQTITYPTIRSKAAIGEQFMDRMQEYMKLQDTHDFDVQQHLMELYEDLSNLYNDNK